jgi:hypothetical protein
MLLEIWVLGAILVLVGLLAIACGFSHGEFGLYLPAAGMTSIGVGSVVFVNNFRKWFEKL